MENQGRPRTHRQQKRRRNKRMMFSFILLAALFFLLLLILIFGGKKDQEELLDNDVSEEQSHLALEDENADEIEDLDEEPNSETEENEMDSIYGYQADDIVIQYVEVDGEDDNVIEAYKGSWPPIGTIQEEPHNTNYEDGSIDRTEMRRAILLVTNIEENNLIEHWIGNGGEQKVIATVEDRSTRQVYRIYLSWIAHEGWQATLVEKLREYTG